MGRPRRCSLVNDRPVMIVETPDGGADCVVLDWASGSFVIDRSYFSRTLPGDFADVDSVTPEQMDVIVAEHRARILHRFATRLAADATDDADVLEVLGLRPDTPPFDADDMEPTMGPGLFVAAPRLLRRHLLDAAFGDAASTPGPADTTAVTYRLLPTDDGHAACTVLAVFPTDTPTAEAVLVQLARGEGPTDPLTASGRADAP